jgi:hypothetical protein
MIRASKRWISLGVYNQQLYKHHNFLIERKEDLTKEKAELRVLASKINGPLTVRQWAEARGMVSVAILPQEGISAYIPIPSYQPPMTGLELSTVWR